MSTLEAEEIIRSAGEAFAERRRRAGEEEEESDAESDADGEEPRVRGRDTLKRESEALVKVMEEGGLEVVGAPAPAKQLYDPKPHHLPAITGEDFRKTLS